jgi:hypothetical protein
MAIKTAWTALTLAQLVRVLGTRGYDRAGVRDVAELVNTNGRGSHVAISDDASTRALVSIGNTECDAYDVEISPLPDAAVNVPVTQVKPGMHIAGSGFEITSVSPVSPDYTVTIHYRYHLGNVPMISNLVKVHFDTVRVLANPFEIGDQVTNIVSRKTGRVTGLGKMTDRGEIVATVTVETPARWLSTGTETITYAARYCLPAAPVMPATGQVGTPTEVPLVGGYVCESCAYGIAYGEFPEDITDEVVNRATEYGAIRMVADIDGHDDMRSDECQIHGDHVGGMYPVSMTRVIA